MRFIVKTPNGPITSYRSTWSGAYVWRTDGERPVHWGSEDAATKWIDDVWRSDPKQKARSGWEVLEVE